MNTLWRYGELFVTEIKRFLEDAAPSGEGGN
jgi:hypothetical protein